MTRYDRITVDFNVEFAGPGSFTIDLTSEIQDSPQFRAFLLWAHEVLQEQMAVKMAQGPGNITFL